jgi:acylphosphatase
MERRRIVFSGRVQGVGFRATTRSIARKHPVTGWVRNREDGTVEMEIQGPGPAIDACLADLRSRMAGFIKAENANATPPEPDEKDFEIRR